MAMAYANANAVSRTLSTISSFSLDKSSHSHPSSSSSSSSSLAFPHQLVTVGLKTFEGFHCRPSVGCTKILQKSEKLQVEGDRTCRVSVRFAASTAPPLTVPKQKIRIKLRSYWVSLIEQSCKQIMDAARTTNAKTMGPVPLPTKRRIYCVLKSPHVHKDAREHLEMRTHQRLIDIENPNADTIDALMQLDIPAGVDVEVKL